MWRFFVAKSSTAPWKQKDHLHGIPGDDPQVGEPENAAGRGQEIHAGRTAHPISTGQNGQLMWWMTQNVIHRKNILRYGSPHVDILTTWGKLAAAWINVDNLSTLTPFVLRLTSTWHFVKPRWNLVSADFRYLPDYCNTIALWWVTKTVTHHLEVVNGQNIHLPPSHNAQILVGGHFDHQPNNRNALLCESGCYHFGVHPVKRTTKQIKKISQAAFK